MKIKNKIFALIIIGLFSACEKQTSVQDTNKGEVNSNLIASYSSTRLFTDSQILKIANYHNLYTDSILNQVDLTLTNEIAINGIAENYFSSFEDSFNLNISIPDSTAIINSISNHISNQSDFNNMMDSIKSLMLNLNINSSSCYANLVSNLQTLKVAATTNFSGTDLDAAFVLIETTKKSAHYWLPLNAGGSGLGYNKLIDYTNDPNYIPQMSLSKIIGYTALADGVSAMYFMFVVAIGGTINPTLIPAGILAYFGVRAGHASIVTFFNLLPDLD